jgi:predicted metal-dependent hydrolase
MKQQRKHLLSFFSLNKTTEPSSDTPGFITLDRLDHKINIPVRCSNRAKRISIKINHEGAELILPLNKHYNAGYKFLLSKESWVRQKLQNAIKPEAIDDKIIPIFDEIYSLHHIEANYRAVSVKDNLIEIYSKDLSDKSVLIKFLQDKLLLEVTKLANNLSAEHDLIFSKIKIINNKSKWGSCSSKAVISFNWRLVFAPKNILKYLVVHEMCHIIEMNHSTHFWNLVEKFCPDYKLAKLWLKKNGLRLHQYLQL